MKVSNCLKVEAFTIYNSPPNTSYVKCNLMSQFLIRKANKLIMQCIPCHKNSMESCICSTSHSDRIYMLTHVTMNLHLLAHIYSKR